MEGLQCDKKKQCGKCVEEVLKPGDYNVRMDVNITISSLFNNNGNFLSYEDMRNKLGKGFGELNYNGLKHQIRLNYGPELHYVISRAQAQKDEDPHQGARHAPQKSKFSPIFMQMGF